MMDEFVELYAQMLRADHTAGREDLCAVALIEAITDRKVDYGEERLDRIRAVVVAARMVKAERRDHEVSSVCRELQTS